MKPIKILHGNEFEDRVAIVVEIELNQNDKQKIHDLHIERGGKDYDINDVSFLVWIDVDKDGIISGYSYSDECYYPAEQGEMYYDNQLLPPELEHECMQFVKDNYNYKEKIKYGYTS